MFMLVRWRFSDGRSEVRCLPAWLAPLSGHGRVSLWRQRGHEAEKLQRELVGVAVIGAELGGDIRDLVQVEDAGDGIADGGHGPVRAAGAAGVLPENDITVIVMHLN